MPIVAKVARMANGRGSRDRVRDPIKSNLKEGLKRVLNWRRWWLPVTFGLMLLVLGVTVAVMINPATTGPSLPLTEEEVGTISNVDVRAPISFNLPDIEATKHKRMEAESAIRSVYDFEQELGRDRVRRLEEAFASMQRIVAQHESELEEEHPEPDEGVEPDADTADGERKRSKPRKGRKLTAREAAEQAQLQDAEATRNNEVLSEKLEEQKDEFQKLLQIVVKDDDFAQLKGLKFSTETLRGLTELVDRNMRHMIVPSRELLALDRAKGITVRFLKDGLPQREMPIVSFSRIMDIEEALERVEQTAALDLGEFKGAQRATLVRLAKGLVAPNMFFNRAETDRRKQEAGENVQPLETSYKKDEIILRFGEKIQKKHVRAFQQMARLTEVSNAGQMAFGTVLLVVITVLFVTLFAARNIRKFRKQARDLGLLALVMFVSLVSVKLWFWIFDAVWERFHYFNLESYYFAIPFAAGAMLIRFVLNSEMALAFTAVFAVLAGMLMDSNLGWAIYCLVSSLIAAAAVGKVRQRTSLLYAGALAGLGNMLLAVSMGLFAGSFMSFQTVFSALFAFSGGILAAMIVTGVAPVIEVAFGYTTDIKLLELANLNHPLLKDLIVQAPGSYHHSIIVGSLVEAGAEAIHCNPLLARVMAYYHDIGKIKKPAYFSENQRDGVNRHDKLKPSLSASVLRAHVKDGAELAREYRLGGPIVDAIVQHHGTSLMKFFYQRAKDQSEEGDTIKEEDFRYPGPKPGMREVALVMLADSVEAAAKSISDPSPARLQGLVQNMINRIFVDGQLDECDLTLKDLHEIARAFNRVLAGIYHHRPDYPEPATRDAREREAAEKKAKAEPIVHEPLKEGEEKRQDTPDDKQENIKRLGI